MTPHLGSCAPAEHSRPGPALLPMILLAVSCVSCLAGCATPPKPNPGVGAAEGMVSREGVGVPGATVTLLDPRFHIPPGAPPVAVATSAEDGAFRLEAPPGRYLISARNEDGFSFFGRNPITLRGTVRGLNLPLAQVHPMARTAAPEGAERVEGRVLRQGRPVAGARVFVYLDPSSGFRGPGYSLTDPTGDDGRYQLTVEPGTYFLVARFRQGGWKMGELDPGDLFGVLPVFPLVISPGDAVSADIDTVVVPDNEKKSRYRGAFPALRGRIVDAAGTPQAGMRAVLYADEQMLDRPAVVSDPTGTDGRFLLRAAAEGVHYLGARERLGGPPLPGERIGFHRGNQGARVEIVAGTDLSELEIVTQEVP